MKTPPLLLGFTLLFWGWQTGTIPAAAAMAIILEGSRLARWRWNFSDDDFSRVSDLCALLLIASAVYLYGLDKTTHSPWALLQWLPLIVFPLVVFQMVSTSETVPIRAFFLTLRRKRAARPEESGTRIGLTYPYFVLCILSTSTANDKTSVFYGGACLLAAWALWSTRSKRYSPATWGGLLVLASLVGFAGHVGLHALQKTVEEKVVGLFSASFGSETDPDRSATAIGHIGTLQLSGRIALRVEPGEDNKHPDLLREAGYDTYHASMWIASHAAFDAVDPGPDGATWTFSEEIPRGENRIYADLKGGKGVLALPTATTRILALPVGHMQINRFGAVRVSDGPGLIAARVASGSVAHHDGPPGKSDLTVPPEEAAAVSQIAAELRLREQSPAAVLTTLSSFFQDRFTYSKYNPARESVRESDVTPLGDFLLRSRSGHCEYFATAAVLLLREAGIPARYATGYAIHEYSNSEKMFVARGRDAHAWALAYIDGAWRDFDPTPAIWVGVEENAASFWEPLEDLRSRVVFLFSKWRWGESGGGYQKAAVWILIPLVILSACIILSKKRLSRLTETAGKADALPAPPGVDSEFYRVEKRLIESGFSRHPWETLAGWIRRIESEKASVVMIGSLHSMLELHYRLRFDPEGISESAKRALQTSVRSWLEQHPVKR